MWHMIIEYWSDDYWILECGCEWDTIYSDIYHVNLKKKIEKLEKYIYGKPIVNNMGSGCISI